MSHWPKVLVFELHLGKNVTKVEYIREMLVKNKWIIHAGGFVEDNEGKLVDYTNSKESLLNCYKHGNKVSEFDFMLSTDGVVVCAHGWESYKRPDGVVSRSAMSKELFLASRARADKTPMLLDDLILFMRKHEDFYVVTDVKDDNVQLCTIIRRLCPDLLDRFIIQIYKVWQYEPIYNLGFHLIIFTLYRTKPKERQPDIIHRFAETHPLVGLTFWYYWLDTNPGWYNSIKDINVPLFGHTLNNRTKIETYFQRGLSGMYTDAVDLNE